MGLFAWRSNAVVKIYFCKAADEHESFEHWFFGGIMIRKLTIGDFEKVEPMMAALHKIHVENRSDFYSENAHPLTKKEFKAMLKDKNKIALTFAENGEIAGIALATIKDRTVRSIYIDAIFVLEPFRRRGIATRLFRQIQDTASEIGAERMDLMVWAFNAPALAFYKSLGMQEQRIVLEKHVKETDDAICVF